ncbi:Cellulose-binding domain protein [Minicystis rosea]|nr:Cellulose-binding domain protein [Minicystis rosea]
MTALLVAGCAAANASRVESSAPRVEPHAPIVAEVVAAPAPLRRLTNEEYNNTIRDLLGDTSRPADAFPPDEAIGGFENNTVSPITQALVERYMEAAEAIAARASGRLDKLSPCPPAALPEACARNFIETFGRLAFRRPLEDGERAELFAIFAEKQKRSGYARGIQLVITAILESPSFLYRLEPADGGTKTRPLTGYEVATRLAYFIWASTPDAALLDDAAAGKLSAREGVERAARRLLEDRRAVDGIRSFHRQWLELRVLDTASKDPVLHPGFTPELKAAMVEETLRFTAYAVLAGGDTVATLLTSRKSFVNASLAKLYGVPAPSGDALIELPPRERSGLLTQASVMTALAGAEDASPILRGKFVREKLLCETIRPPPPDVDTRPPPFDAKQTKKDRFARHTTDPSCALCHDRMDPVGFGFEHYDALGAWRSVDGSFPVDATGKLWGTDDTDGPFDGAVALAARLAASTQVRRCIATQWFRAAVGRDERLEDRASREAAYQAFARAGFDVRELIVAITGSDAFRHAGFDEGGTE